MPKNDAACLLPSALCNLVRNDFTDPAKAKFAAFHIAFDLFAMFWSRTFSDHNNTPQIASRLTRFDHARDFVEIEWNFGNQNNIGAACDAAVQRDPAGVATHYFDHHDAPVTGRRGVHPIERVHYDCDSGIESE